MTKQAFIIIVGGEKGGIGKTNTAVNLAVHVAHQFEAEFKDGTSPEKSEVLLLDTDKTGSASSWARLRGEFGLSPHIPILTLPEKPVNELTSLATKYDVIIIDIGAQNYRTFIECSIVADIILVPTDADQQTLESTLSVMSTLRSNDARHIRGKMPAYVLANRVSTNSKSVDEQIIQDAIIGDGQDPFPLLKTVLRNRNSIMKSRRIGAGVMELTKGDRDPKATQEFSALFQEILEIVSSTQ